MLTSVVVAMVGCLPAGTPMESGVEQRLSTNNGPVWVWCGSQSEPDETVIFVHGHERDAERVWRDHGLPEQFRRSRRNALFVAPEAPVAAADAVKWESVETLLSVVEQATKTRVPRRLLVVGHSGAYRTIAKWLGSPLVAHVVLLDGVYGDMAEYRQWLSREEVSLHLVSSQTWVETEGLVSSLDEEQRARVRPEKSRLGHWELVANRITMPRVLAEQPGATDWPGVVSR